MERLVYFCGDIALVDDLGIEECMEIQEPLKKLHNYELAEEQGLLLRLPYNIATCGVVYYVDEKDHEIYYLQADNIRVSKMMISNRFLYEVDNFEFFYEDFGKIVFTTKEEAEQKLAEYKGE